MLSKKKKWREHDQKVPEDVAFIRELTYALPITLEEGLADRKCEKGLLETVMGRSLYPVESA